MREIKARENCSLTYREAYFCLLFKVCIPESLKSAAMERIKVALGRKQFNSFEVNNDTASIT